MSNLPAAGYVYVMVNGSMPNLCKLGYTTLSPAERARQLTTATACPTPFVVAYSRTVHDVVAAEAKLHQLLADRRVNNDREFFQCSVLEACLALDRIAGGSDLVLDPPLPWSELFATFPDEDNPRELTVAERAKCRELAADLAAERSAFPADYPAEWREAA